MKNGQTTSLPSLSVTLPLEEYQVLLDQLGLLEPLKQEILENQKEIDHLRWRMTYLERLLWGRSSEKRRLPEDPAQLSICFEQAPVQADPEKEEEQAAEEIEQEKTVYSRFRKRFRKERFSHARQPIPANLPRIKTVLEPEVNLEGAVRMGEEITERYAIQPRRLYVEQLVRPRYKLTDGCIAIAPLPVMAHPRSNASESVLAHIAVSKYADHLPLNRQIEIFEREGVRLPESTVSNWMMATAQCIEPIYNELRETLKESRYVQADETVHKVLENDKPGSLHQGYMWGFYLPHCKSPYFEYHPGRGSSALGTLLSGNTEVVQSDGYSVYDIFDKLKGKVHICCWAHVRRKFVEALTYDPPPAWHALGEIGKLYGVEKEIREKGLDRTQAVALRQEKAYPVIKKLEEWSVENLLKTPQNSPLDKAIRYMYTRFEQLSHYVNDGELSIDNNAAYPNFLVIQTFATTAI
jgi:transposase